MSAIFLENSCQLKFCQTQYYLTLNVGYFTYPNKKYKQNYRHSNAHRNIENFDHVIFE